MGCLTELIESDELKSQTCSKSSSTYVDFYSNKEFFIPKEIDKPITIHVNFNVWQRSDGTGNLSNNTTHVNRIKKIFSWVNSHFFDLTSFSVPLSYSVNNLPDSKIRIQLDSIYFYQDPSIDSLYYYGNVYGFNFCNGDTVIRHYPSNLLLEQYIQDNYPERKGLNIHLTGGRYCGAGGFFGGNAIQSFYKRDPEMDNDDVHDWWFSQHFAHEIGHALGLSHTYDSPSGGGQNCYINGKDFLWDVFDTLSVSNCPTPYNYCDVCLISGGEHNNNIMGGGTIGHISDLQKGIIHRNLRTFNNFGWSSNKGIKNHATGFDTIPFQINQNETWDFPLKMYQDLVINPGNTLTIKCSVEFVPEAKIIIKQGARLIIDGGKLTNEHYYNSFWQGIEVWGTADKNQFPANHPTHQGLLIVKNGGIIENAHHAVSNWRKDHWDQIGGVIQVTNGIFRNNRRDVEFMSYQNYSQTYSQEYPNLSFFTDTDFVSDDDFIEQNLPLQSHVSMWNVDGIVFKNCHFKNEITANKANSSAPRKGIFSLDAGYQILPKCTAQNLPIGQACPTAQLFKSSFSGLEVGIEASSAGTTETITVRQTDFLDNIFGILVNEMDHVSLTQNTFEIGNAGYSNNPYFGLGLGVKIDNSTGFKIEENTIESDLTSGLQVGVWVNNSGSDDNRVYKNDIQNLYLALHSTGKNHNSNLQKGLQFLCNTLQDNTIAIGVGSSPTNDGIRLYQGDFSPSKSAGNTFVSNDTDIHNAANSIIYIHNGGNKEPNIYTGLVTLQTTTTANTCPSSFGPPIMFEQYNSMIDSLGLVFSDLTDSYENLKYSYTTLIDNGNTEDFKENIELNWSSDAWLLRTNLLDNSPYLSSEVLLKSVEQNVLPNGMLLEILLANPDATKGEHFIEKLNEATQYNFPEYMQDYVRANYDLLTLRTEMEGQLASIHSNRADVKDWMTYLIKSKDEYQTIDRLNVINLGQELYSKVGLIDYYVSENHFTQADSVLQAVQMDKKYQDELSLIDNLEDYLNFRSDLNTRNLTQLDSTEISYLQNLAQGTSRASGYAQNILCYFYDICFESELTLLNAENKMLSSSTKNTAELANVLYDFKIFPNPAKEYVSITWEIFDNLTEATYSITDLTGKTHLHGAINANKGEQQIDTRMLKEGLYILNIHNNNQIKTSKKLIILNQAN